MEADQGDRHRVFLLYFQAPSVQGWLSFLFFLKDIRLRVPAFTCIITLWANLSVSELPAPKKKKRVKSHLFQQVKWCSGFEIWPWPDQGLFLCTPRQRPGLSPVPTSITWALLWLAQWRTGRGCWGLTWWSCSYQSSEPAIPSCPLDCITLRKELWLWQVWEEQNLGVTAIFRYIYLKNKNYKSWEKVEWPSSQCWCSAWPTGHSCWTWTF